MQLFDETRAALGLAASGAVLTLVGLAKIADHVAPLRALDAAICGASAMAPFARVMLAEAAHCWGCPLAVAGGLTLLAALALGRTRPLGPDRPYLGAAPF